MIHTYHRSEKDALSWMRGLQKYQEVGHDAVLEQQVHRKVISATRLELPSLSAEVKVDLTIATVSFQMVR